MTNAPALIVHYRRFTLVIAILLAGQIVVAAVGISIELHQSQAGLALILAPQILVLLAAYLAKTACDRWATSAICLTVSAEGLMIPGLTERPIPWTAVKSVRGLCCSPSPERAAIPRHYIMFDVDAPESFGVKPPSAVHPLTMPRPAGAPLVSLDLSELDTGKEAILEAVRRFHPAAVADPEHPLAVTAFTKEASMRFPTLQEITLSAGQLRADIAWVITHRRHVWPVVADELRHAVAVVRTRAAELTARGDRRRRYVLARLQRRVLSARRQAMSLRRRASADAARRLEIARAAALGLRQRLDRSRQMNNQ